MKSCIVNFLVLVCEIFRNTKLLNLHYIMFLEKIYKLTVLLNKIKLISIEIF